MLSEIQHRTCTIIESPTSPCTDVSAKAMMQSGLLALVAPSTTGELVLSRLMSANESQLQRHQQEARDSDACLSCCLEQEEETLDSTDSTGDCFFGLPDD